MTNSVRSSNRGEQPAEFWLGVEQFNQGDYYACHDTLEAIWLEAEPGERAFYQGILQIAVGLYHLTNFNWKGAAILLGEGSNRLLVYGEDHGGINLTELIDQASDWLTALQETGPEQVQQVASWLEIQPDTGSHRAENGIGLAPPKIQSI